MLSVTMFVCPILAASLTPWLLAGVVRSLALFWRVAVLIAVSGLAAFLVERLARRLLPLTALLRLTMVFPDRAPSRFAVARQAGNPAELLARVGSPDLDEATAAQNILALVGALASHDRKTRGHSERVRAYTDLLGEALELDVADRDRLRWSALLHDIGKLLVGVELLNKPGKPTDLEWRALRAHPEHGQELAGPLLPWLGVWGRAIVEHHERFDGDGYPHGLSGEQISLGGRVLGVVDSFETMTAVRPYKKAMSHRAAREELARCAGSQFDPVLVRAFLAISLPRVIWAMGPVSAAFQLPFVNALQYAGGRALATTGTAATTLSAPLLAATVATVVATPAAVAVSSGHPPHRNVSTSSRGSHANAPQPSALSSARSAALPDSSPPLAASPPASKPAIPLAPTTPALRPPVKKASPPVPTKKAPPPTKKAPPPAPTKKAPPPTKKAPPPAPTKKAPPPTKKAPPPAPTKKAPPPTKKAPEVG